MTNDYLSHIVLLLLFLVAFAVRAVSPDTSYFFWDETIYLLHGRLISGQEVGYSETFLRPPLLPVLLSPFASLQSYELASRLLVAFLNSLVVIPVFLLSKAVFRRYQVAALAAAMVALLPVNILNSRWIMADAPGALLAFSSVAAYLIGFNTGKRHLIIAGGLLAGLAVLMKFTNLLLLPLLLPLLWLYRRSFRDFAFGILPLLAVLLPFLAFSLFSFGSPFSVLARAFHVVAEADPAGPGFLLYLLQDSLGFLLLFLLIGIFAYGKRALYLAYCLAVALAYSFFIVGRGVSKPPGIEWEAGRFLLLSILFAAPFIAAGILASFDFLKRRANFFIAAVFFTFIAALTVVSLLPQLERTYLPAVSHEDGLRHVTKEAGVYLAGIDVAKFGCLGNCPPVAYYSGRSMSAYYSAAELSAGNHGVIVVFDGSMDNFTSSYSIKKEFCSGSHCAYVLSRQ